MAERYTNDAEADAIDRAVRFAAPAPRWCQDLAKAIVTTVNEWAADGATEQHLVQCVADLLEQDLLDQRIIERLATVYTVDTDQAALIALVQDAQAEVARVR